MHRTTFSTYEPGKQAQILHDFMDLFRGNERGYGIGEFSGATQREDDNKWKPGHVRWIWGTASDEQYRVHLAGELLLGIGPLKDDGSCWFSCLDVDDYDIDYREAMQKIRATGLPIVVFRTKSGGLRICIFFSEAIDAESVIARMRRLAAHLGYSGCEVFPKQTKLLAEKGDCPSWIFLPYSGTREIFSEAGCMNEGGNLMDLDEAIPYCMKRRLNKMNFMNLFAAEKQADDNGKRNGKKHADRVWVEEATKQDNVDAIFWDGPVCTRVLARFGVSHGQQNSFLCHCATFLKRKYENWDKVLEWVNYNILMPVGDREKLSSIIRRYGSGKYEYQCHDEPMHSFCDAHGCRNKRYGVGTNGVDHLDLAMTIVNRKPPIFIVSAGGIRIQMSSQELLNQQLFQGRFLEERVHVPFPRKKDDHINWINTQIDSATVVEPQHIMRSNAGELELLAEWFGRHIPIWLKGVSNDKTDVLRVKEGERKIYFKWERLSEWLRRACKDSDVKAMRWFLYNNCEEHTEGRGHWWRHTISISYDMFDEDQVRRWLEEGDSSGGSGDEGDVR